MAKVTDLLKKPTALMIVVGGIIAVLIVVQRVSSVLPKILGDELSYSMDARHYEPSQALVPNYLFNMLFSSTSVCGYGFYTCSKILNLVMLFGITLVVFFTAKLVADTKISLLLAFLAFLGPVSSYVSYFTPDIMFFLAASIIIFSQITMNQKAAWWHWALIGAGVGVSALIKPHGLFLVAPVVAFIIYLASKRSESRTLWAGISSLSFIVALFATKLGLGFLFAGPRGISLFGGSYDSSAGRVITGSSAGTTSGGVVAEGATGSLTPLTWSFSNPIWIGQSAFSLMLHITFLAIFFAVPIVAVFAGPLSKTDPDRAQVSEVYNRARFVIVASLVTLMVVSSIFVVVSQAWGEVLTNRVMVRYYEFAVVFIPVLLAPFLKKPAGYSIAAKWAIGASMFGVTLFAAPVFQNNVPILYADSSLIASSIQSGVGLVAIALVSFTVLIIWFSKPALGAKIWLFGFAPFVILIFNVSSYINMTIPSSIVGQYTQSSRWVHNNLTDEQKNGLIVFGTVKSNVQAAELWIDDPSVTGHIVAEKDQVNLQGLESGKYILVVGGIPVVGDSTTVKKTAYWSVLKVGK